MNGDESEQTQHEFEDGLWSYEEALALWVYHGGRAEDFIRCNGKGDDECMKASKVLLERLQKDNPGDPVLHGLQKRQRAWAA